jgi:hypothetical protein
MRPISAPLLRRAVLTAALLLAITVLPEATRAQDAEPLNLAPADVPVLSGVARALSMSSSEAEALVQQASGLIDARRRGEISFPEYRNGVLHFQKNYPDFYVGFFGDPMFYNLNKQVLVRQRQISSQEVEPFLGARGLERAFLCEGSSWDPFFEQCRGVQFARSDFLTYPTFLNPSAPERVRTLPPVRLAVLDGPMRSASASGESPAEADRPDDRLNPSAPLAAPAQRTDGNRSLKARASDNREAPSRGSADRRRTTTSIEAMASEIRPAPRRARTDRDEWERVTDGLSPDDARIVRQALRHHDRSTDRTARRTLQDDRERRARSVRSDNARRPARRSDDRARSSRSTTGMDNHTPTIRDVKHPASDSRARTPDRSPSSRATPDSRGSTSRSASDRGSRSSSRSSDSGSRSREKEK